MRSLKAAHLNQQVVVTGGEVDDEVLCGIIWLVMRCLACLQVLQYNTSTNTWTQIGSLKDSRARHAVAEVNLAALGCVGNLNRNHHHCFSPEALSLVRRSLLWCIHMGRCPQDGENEQNLSEFFVVWSFTVTKRFDFFKFSQLFWRDYVRWFLKNYQSHCTPSSKALSTVCNEIGQKTNIFKN